MNPSDKLIAGITILLILLNEYHMTVLYFFAPHSEAITGAVVEALASESFVQTTIKILIGYLTGRGVSEIARTSNAKEDKDDAQVASVP